MLDGGNGGLLYFERLSRVQEERSVTERYWFLDVFDVVAAFSRALVLSADFRI
jgi:hypothetical protein